MTFVLYVNFFFYTCVCMTSKKSQGQLIFTSLEFFGMNVQGPLLLDPNVFSIWCSVSGLHNAYFNNRTEGRCRQSEESAEHLNDNSVLNKENIQNIFFFLNTSFVAIFIY